MTFSRSLTSRKETRDSIYLKPVCAPNCTIPLENYVSIFIIRKGNVEQRIGEVLARFVGISRDRYLARLTKETIAAHMWNRRWLATYSVCTSRSMEKKEPLTRAIILGRTRLELRAANSGVSWHSLAGHGHGEEEARETWDREGRDGLQGLLLSILIPVPMRSSVKSPRNKRLKILASILFVRCVTLLTFAL